ncbi:hypothetical protein Peur_069618 [Populus x canadensis]
MKQKCKTTYSNKFKCKEHNALLAKLPSLSSYFSATPLIHLPFGKLLVHVVAHNITAPVNTTLILKCKRRKVVAKRVNILSRRVCGR